jgi:hypothetical protein
VPVTEAKGPINACINLSAGCTYCMRCPPDTEFVFVDGEYAAAFYDRRTNVKISASMLGACPKCCDTLRQRLKKEAEARAK